MSNNHLEYTISIKSVLMAIGAISLFMIVSIVQLIKQDEIGTPYAMIPKPGSTFPKPTTLSESDQQLYDSNIRESLASYLAGDYQKSIEWSQKAIAVNPASATAYNNLAAAYGALEMWDEEIDACIKALEIDPGLQLAKNNLRWATEQRNVARDNRKSIQTE